MQYYSLRYSEEQGKFITFLFISLIVHLIFLIFFLIGAETIRRGISLIGFRKPGIFYEEGKEKDKVYYVKILDMPKPPKVEEPEEKDTPIISQYTTRKKGPMGIQEKSKLSGDSPVLHPIPGVPYGTDSSGGADKGIGGGSVAGYKPGPQTGSGSKDSAKASTESKGEEEGTTMKYVPTESAKKAGKAEAETSRNGAAPSGVGAGLPKERLPLIDPRLVDKYAKKIVPQMGKEEIKGGVVEISLDARESKYISYFKKIRDKIYLVWRYPPEAAASGIQGTVGIYFVINRSGEVVEAVITDSSGFTILDKTALNAIYRAAPFGPFPSDWPEKELRIRARFIYTIYSRSPF